MHVHRYFLMAKLLSPHYGWLIREEKRCRCNLATATIILKPPQKIIHHLSLSSSYIKQKVRFFFFLFVPE